MSKGLMHRHPSPGVSINLAGGFTPWGPSRFPVLGVPRYRRGGKVRVSGRRRNLGSKRFPKSRPLRCGYTSSSFPLFLYLKGGEVVISEKSEG